MILLDRRLATVGLFLANFAHFLALGRGQDLADGQGLLEAGLGHFVMSILVGLEEVLQRALVLIGIHRLIELGAGVANGIGFLFEDRAEGSLGGLDVLLLGLSQVQILENRRVDDAG